MLARKSAVGRALVYQTTLDGHGYSFGAPRHIEFVVELSQVGLDGAHGEAEVVGDMGVTFALHQELDDLCFALAEGGFGLLVFVAKRADDEGGDLVLNIGATIDQDSDRAQQFRLLHVLCEVAIRAGVERPENSRRVAVHGENQDRQGGVFGFDLLDQPGSIVIGQRDVYNDQIYTGVDLAETLFSGRRGSTNNDLTTEFNQLGEAFSKNTMIVNEKHVL